MRLCFSRSSPIGNASSSSPIENASSSSHIENASSSSHIENASSSSHIDNGSSCANIGILSLTEREDIKQFVDNHQGQGQIKLCPKTLEFEDLLDYTPPSDWNAVILLHSAKLGRLSLTDVPDARYDKLLEVLHNERDRKLIFVIAHDVKDFQKHSREEQLLNLRCAQESVFKYAEHVIICDTLNTLHKEDRKLLDNFLKRAITENAQTEPNVKRDHGTNQHQGRGVATSSMAQFGDHVPEIVGEDDPIKLGITVESDSSPVTPVGSSSSEATPSNRQCKSTNPSPTAATPIPKPTRKRPRHTAVDDGYLQVQTKRCKHDVEGIQAEKETIS